MNINTKNQIADVVTTLADYVASEKGHAYLASMGKVMIALGNVYQDKAFTAPLCTVVGEVIRHVGSAACKIVEVVEDEIEVVNSNQVLKDAWKELEDAIDGDFEKAMDDFETETEALLNEVK